MGKSSIEWTDYTFQPWMGCQRVSPGCEHCYAEAFARRIGHGTTKPLLWGPNSERRMMSEPYWREPLRWNAKAAAEGVRRRVFCASMADVFEDRPELAAPRARLYALVRETPHLDWLLLTKRPENAAGLWLAAFGAWLKHDYTPWLPRAGEAWPSNVWLGTTVEDQRRADERIPHLLSAPARVRFLSVEPMLGPIDLSGYIGGPYVRSSYIVIRRRGYWLPGDAVEPNYNAGIDWVICGGESGPGARPMHPRWARDLRDQCESAGVPFFFKQWGEWVEGGPIHQIPSANYRTNRDRFVNLGGGHGFHGEDVRWMRKAGKADAGRVLDGRTWDEFPVVEL